MSDHVNIYTVGAKNFMELVNDEELKEMAEYQTEKNRTRPSIYLNSLSSEELIKAYMAGNEEDGFAT